MQRKDAGLDAEPEEGQPEERRHALAARIGPRSQLPVRAASAVKNTKRAAATCDEEIQPPRRTGVAPAAIERDQKWH
jgi:hypothetical protein